MFGLNVIEVVIGLIFVYMILSLRCSAISELIAQIASLRARTLQEGITRLLSSDQIRAKFYRHPLIKCLGREPRKQVREQQADGKDRHAHVVNPSYIPSRAFALAVLDVAAGLGKKEALKADPNDPGHVAALDSAPLDFAGLRATIADLPQGDLRTALLTLFDAAGKDLDQARLNVAEWFDSAMDRVSGWYKRRTQWILLFVAIAVASVMNADTISLANSFMKNPALRQRLVAAADRYIESAGDLDRTDASLNSLRRQLETLGDTDLPLGWSKDALPSGSQWILKIIGIFFTGFAASLGAQFWFDLLNKVTRLRVSGQVPKRAGAEK